MLTPRFFLQDQTILASSNLRPPPTVSVILPTYSRCQTGQLERSIRCVLGQTYRDFEFLVMDDGSTDGSSDLIEKYRAEDDRIIHVRHEQNCGLPALRVNEGIELARGRYLAFQFDDDFWRPNALSDLVAEAERRAELAVVVGRSLFHTRVGDTVLPSAPLDAVTLYEDNRCANNSVFFPRALVERFGMYDPHIGMRRLCDWDLWLRLVRHVPFITLEQVISEVYESNAGAIGVTVPWDLALFRYLNSIPRDALLTLKTWRDYPLDSLAIAGVDIPGEYRRRTYEEQIVPYYFKMRHVLPGLGSFSATLPAAATKTVLFTKQSYDVCNEVTLGHYDALTSQRGSFKTHYQVLDQVSPTWPAEADQLMLVRTVEEPARRLLDQALQTGRPVSLYLDDDLLHFHEFGPQYDYLAPGTPYHKNLSEIAAVADAVLVTNDFIGSSIRPLNPRVLPHNNCVLEEHLPDRPHARGQDCLRIGYVGSGYRIEEFRQFWQAFIRISREYGKRLSFEFWGMDISSLPLLASPTVQKPFTFSYPYYLQTLRQANFDILLTPMLDHPRPRLGKSLIKYYEIAVAGALGIFSDVPQYQQLPAGVTCLKAKNDVESWYEALRQAIEMPVEQFDALRQRCLAHVRAEFTAEAQVDLHEAALRAVEFHARTRSLLQEAGCPRVMYVLHSAHYGGAEIQLWRRLRLARQYGIQPIVVIPGVLKDSENGILLRDQLAADGISLEAVDYTCFTEPRSPAEFSSDLEREQLRELMQRCKPAVVHAVTFIPSLGQVCQEMKIPLVNTLYAVQDDFAWSTDTPDFVHCQVVQSDCLRYARRWGELLATEKICARDMAPQELFLLGQRKSFGADPRPIEPVTERRAARLVVTGTFQERKQQLETIEALGRLKAEGLADFELIFYGYTHFFPEYVEKCRAAIARWGLASQVSLRDFTDDLAGMLGDVDMLLSLSTYESFPGSIKDAMAAGVLVVATPVGGVAELIVDRVSGILCAGTAVEALVAGIRRALALSPEQRKRIVDQASSVARQELHPQRAANDLFRMYNLALERTRSSQMAVIAPGVARQAPSRSVAGRASVKSPTRPATSVMPVGAGLVYPHAPSQANWNGLDIFVGTYQRLLAGALVLRVRSAGGNLLREVRVDLAHARDNDWLQFRFAPIANSAGHTFRLEFQIEKAGRGTRLSFYQNAPTPRRAIHLFRRALQMLGIRLHSSQLHCREWYA